MYHGQPELYAQLQLSIGGASETGLRETCDMCREPKQLATEHWLTASRQYRIVEGVSRNWGPLPEEKKLRLQD